MSAVFLTILNMSITAGWVISAVIILRFFLRKAPKWPRCVLWAIVALRLICPFSFESRFSLMPDREVTDPGLLQNTVVPAVHTGVPAMDEPLNVAVSTPSASAPEPGATHRHTWLFAGSIIWICGMAAMLGYAVVSFLGTRRKMAEAVRLYDHVYLCDAVRSPFILGAVRPRIYLPSDMEEPQMKYVLAHEQAHLKRRDHWWKLLGYCLLAVYWFNPLVWAAYILLCQDIELACDEKAVRGLNMNGRKAYSKALVDYSMKRRMIMACPLAFGEVGVKKRAKTVLYYKKPAFWLIMLTVAACAGAALCFLTDPRKEESLAEMIEAQKEELTEQIGAIISEAEAVRYSITDWELLVEQTDGNRADCYFGANWISSRRPEDDPMIQGIYQAAESLSDEAQKALALETADGWLAEMQSWPSEEYLEQPIVVMQEEASLVLFYPYVMDGVEELIPLEEYAAENWTEDAEKRYQDGVNIITEAVSTAPSNMPNDIASGSSVPNGSVPGSSAPNADTPGTEIKEGTNYYNLKAVYSDSLLLDEIEWIWTSNKERGAELGIDFEQYGSPYYIYNETVSDVRCYFAEECSFTLLNWHEHYNTDELTSVDSQTFLDWMAERDKEYPLTAYEPVFIIEIADGKIISVTEQLVQ